MSQTENNETHNGNKGRLWRRPRLWFLFGIPLGGFLMFIAGIIFWGGFNTAMVSTNSLEFCTSCHEMGTVYKEYKQSVHYQNAAGVRAICSDCHVPKDWIHMVQDKVRATFVDLTHKALGTISTPEKFKAKRLELAEYVWANMKASDSRECRNCHSLESMKLADQGKSARKKHTLERRDEKGETCIDCHKGIAHELPEGYEG